MTVDWLTYNWLYSETTTGNLQLASPVTHTESKNKTTTEAWMIGKMQASMNGCRMKNRHYIYIDE